MIMMRHRLPPGFRRHREASAPLPAPPQPGGGPELPSALHGEGHDHIGGGSGIQPAIAADPVIDLRDGTRIVFGTAAGLFSHG
jgi:hypothetical protein